MRRAAQTLLVAALLAAVGGPAAPARGQGLDLGGRTPAPQLERPSAAETLAGDLENEIAELLTREPEAAPVERLVLRAMVNVRVMAADLLAAGDEAGEDGSPAVLAALTLAHGRDAIDDRLAALAASPGGADGEPAERARRALTRFNEASAGDADAVRRISPASLDRSASLRLAPLADALVALEPGAPPLVTHWIHRDDVRDASGGDGASTPARFTQAELAARLDRSTLPEPTRALLAEILDYLRRAEPFADLRALAEGYRDVVGHVFLLEDALDDAGWLDDAQRRAYLDRVQRALALFRDPATRGRGERRLAHLDSTRRTIELVNDLAEDARADVRPVAETFAAVDSALGGRDDSDTAETALERLAEIVERMIRHRRRAALSVGGPLQVAYRQLERRADDAEAALLTELRTIGTDPQAMADPAFLSLVSRHRQLLEDLRRVRNVPAWADAITLLHPPSGRRFATTARRWSEQLLDATERPGAIATMEAFERELGRYYPFPFERELRAAGPDAVEATGGFGAPFLAEVERARREWVEAWAADRGDAPSVLRMQRLHRLLRLMRDTSVLSRLGGDATALNAWAAWELDERSLLRVLSELPSRMKLAVASVIEGDDEALGRQLERLEADAPSARLLGRLADRLGPALGELPGGASSTMGQVLFPPTPAAWMVRHRGELARFCRYAVEEAHARASGRLESAGRLAAYVNDRAQRLLDVIDGEDAR